MKKRSLFMFILAICTVFSVQSQTLYVPGGTGGIATSGNANIGVGTASPSAKFEVKSSGTIGRKFYPSKAYLNITDGGSSLIMDPNEIYGSGHLLLGFNPTNHFEITSVSEGTYSTLMKVNGNGNVGIGTTSPTAKLHVNGSTITKSLSLNGSNATPSVNTFANVLQIKGLTHAAIVYSPGEDRELMFGFHSNGHFYWGTGQSATNPNYYSMFLNGSNGDLGIKGKLTANEVKVKIGGWADFVFADNYVLPSLAEVEQHIKSQHHLSNIPSEAEVLENGIDLGAMDARLLQKIEELTLYTIEQEKKLEAQQTQLENKKQQIDALESRLLKLEETVTKHLTDK